MDINSVEFEQLVYEAVKKAAEDMGEDFFKVEWVNSNYRK